MTLQQMIEEVRQVFPGIGETQVKLDLNKWYKDFCHETRLLRDSYSESILPGTVSYSLATDVDSLYNVRFYTANGTELITPYSLKYQIDNGIITFLSTYGQEITAIPANIATITYHYYAKPGALNSLQDTPAIQEQYHGALVAGVMKSYHKKFPTVAVQGQNGQVSKSIDYNAVNIWEREYRDFEKKAKKEANTNNDNTQYDI